MEKSIKETFLWAIDPFDQEMKGDPCLVRQLLNLAHSSNIEIQPVYVHAVRRGEASREYAIGKEVDRAIENVAAEYLKVLGLTGALPTHVIRTDLDSRKDQVEKLIEFANERHVSFIVVSSHGRSGFQKFIIGSFAENLLLLSKCPVLFLTHYELDNTQSAQIKHVLFSTDFSDYSREAFLLFLLHAKRLSLEISLFYSVTLPAAALASSVGALVSLPENYFPEQMKWAKNEGSSWVSLAETNGVKAQLVVIDEGVCANIGEAILSTAHQEQCGLIVMASPSGAVASFVMGSVARHVFRSNRYPVWVYGPNSIGN